MAADLDSWNDNSLIARSDTNGQFTHGKMHPREGERRGWRLDEVKCVGGNPSWALAWRVWRVNEGRANDL